MSNGLPMLDVIGLPDSHHTVTAAEFATGNGLSCAKRPAAFTFSGSSESKTAKKALVSKRWTSVLVL